MKHAILHQPEHQKKATPRFYLLTRLIIVMLVVLSGILSFVIYQESKLDLQNTLNILEQEGSRLIYQIESYEDIPPLLERGDMRAQVRLLARLGRLLSEESHITYIEIINKAGHTVLHAGTIGPISPSRDEHVAFSLQNDQEVTHTYEDPVTKTIIFEIIEPLEPQKGHVRGETLGALRLGLLLDEVRSQIRATRKAHLYKVAIFTITILIIGIIAFNFLIAGYHYRITTAALRAAEEKNRLIIEKMKQSERLSALGEFSAGIAHEIRNPLASIKNFTQLLPCEYDDPVFRQEFTATVTSEVNRINRIVNELLDYARPRKLNMVKADLAELADETIASLQAQLNSRRAALKKQFSRVPPVQIDPEQIRQVLINLLLNAAEALQEGGTITVAIRENARGETEIAVSDTGRGIPREALADVFKPFFTTRENGTGLGLAIALRIVNEHGGRIDVESTQGRGTVFTIILPAQRSYK